MSKQIAWAGIDPGLTGCACLVTTDRIWFHDYESESKAISKLSEWIDVCNVKFLLEKQFDVRKKGFNVSGKLLINYGFWRGVMTCMNCNWFEKAPQAWQKIIPDRAKDWKDKKARSLYWAKKFYPAVNSVLNYKKHHNRADALLMAHYVRETDLFNGKLR